MFHTHPSVRACITVHMRTAILVKTLYLAGIFVQRIAPPLSPPQQPDLSEAHAVPCSTSHAAPRLDTHSSRTRSVQRVASLSGDYARTETLLSTPQLSGLHSQLTIPLALLDMGYNTESAEWPADIHVPDVVKHIVDKLFRTLDDDNDNAGDVLADEVFTVDGIAWFGGKSSRGSGG